MSSTPHRAPSSKTSTPHHSGSPGLLSLTERMQDAQARNKDYGPSEDSDSPWEGPGGRFDAYGNDSYTSTQLRRDAAIKLDNPELVMMLAMARNDSIPATRHHLTKIMCGYLTQEDIEAEAAGEERERERVREESSRVKAGKRRGGN